MHAVFNSHRPAFVVQDDFLQDPNAARSFALSQTFRADERYFRGQRSTSRYLWPGLREHFESILQRPITRWEEYDTNGVFQFCVGGDQLVYHSDEQDWAAALYLTPNAPLQSGLTLYRSRLTGGRTVEESVEISDRNGNYLTEVDAAVAMYDGKLLDRTAWEVVDTIGNRFNRLVIWNARLVHAATDYFGYDLHTARLFQMFFFS